MALLARVVGAVAPTQAAIRRRLEATNDLSALGSGD